VNTLFSKILVTRVKRKIELPLSPSISPDFSPREFFGAGDRVCVLGHYAWKIRKTGRTVAGDWVHVFTIRNGKVTRFREFNDTAQFAEAYRG
jgi:ketosteroid isomerase-like protein